MSTKAFQWRIRPILHALPCDDDCCLQIAADVTIRILEPKVGGYSRVKCVYTVLISYINNNLCLLFKLTDRSRPMICLEVNIGVEFEYMAAMQGSNIKFNKRYRLAYERTSQSYASNGFDLAAYILLLITPSLRPVPLPVEVTLVKYRGAQYV